MGVCEGPFDNGLATTERAVHQLASLLCLQLDGLGKTDRRLGILLSPLWEVTKKCRLMGTSYSEELETSSTLYYQLQEKERGSGRKRPDSSNWEQESRDAGQRIPPGYWS